MKKIWHNSSLLALALLSGCSAAGGSNNPPPATNIPKTGMYISSQFSESQLQMLDNILYSTRPNPGHDQYTSWRTKATEQAADTLKITMDITLPPSATAASPQPLIIFVHGGGFENGSKEDAQPKVLPYALGGFVVANLDYRLTADNENSPAQRLRAMQSALEDVQNAVRFLKKNAEQYHLDPNRIAMLGVSAGGATTLLNAVEYDHAGAVNDYPGISSRVTAAISTGATLGGNSSQVHYDASDTPVLLFHAKETDVVTKATWTGNVLPTQQKINSSGNTCQVVAQPNLTHTIGMELGGDYWEYIKPFLWEKLRLAGVGQKT